MHDAHVSEGGKIYLVVKTLIAGSVRGKSLIDIFNYMERNEQINEFKDVKEE